MSTYLNNFFNELQQENYETAPKGGYVDKWLVSLPLILCGPILRKVHYDNVSVWLAFKEEVSDIKLYVFEASDPKTIAAGTLRLTGYVKSPLKLGKNLFVTLITAVSSTLKLKSNTIYGYDIFFTHKGVQKQLGYGGVLKDGIRSISYAPYTYPTFCLPSDNINNLKIVHGSCRKPHGGRTDALRALDTMLELNSTNTKERPQLLCLTGDQIYADDVSDILLHKINKAEKHLLGWKEILPKDYGSSQLLPGNRKDIIAKTGNKNTKRGFGTRKISPDDLTTTDADSHLIFFSEFLLMYLFTFSEVLWSNGMPTWKELYPDFKQPTKTSEAPAYISKFNSRLASYKTHKTRLDSFLKSLPYVRKAVANISVLMIFDDHDITDDWFITREWSEIALLKGTTSRRYIFNGLLAYSLFQDWGNNYRKYTSGDGLKILNHINIKNRNNYLNNAHLRANPYAQDIESIVLPALFNDTKNAKEPSWYLINRFRWDYRIDYNSFNLFVLNTRTERQYFEKEKPLANLVRNIHANDSYNPEKLAVIVSAVPVFANIPLEIRQDECRGGKTDLLTAAICRHEDFIGMFEKDQESWSFSGRGFGKLLFFLSSFKKVLILSGDVHHAFTAYIKLWRKSGTSPYQLTKIVQSTSSALKNSTENTHYPAIDKYGLEPNANTIYKRIKVLGRTKPGQQFEQFDNPRFEDPQEYNPDKTRIRLESVAIDPALQYSVKFIRSAGYGIPKPLAISIQQSSQSFKFKDRSRLSPVPGTVVGKDNLSLISFTPDSIVNSIWLANGAREAPDDKEADRLLFPYVNHPVNLAAKTDLSELPVREFDRIRERMGVK